MGRSGEEGGVGRRYDPAVPITRIVAALRRRFDWLLALGLTAVGELDLWVGPPSGSEFHGPRAVNQAFLLLATLPLVWRRRTPLAVLAVVGGSVLIWDYALYAPDRQPPVEPWFALLIVIYSVAAHTDLRRATLGAAVAAVAILAVDIAGWVGGQSAGELAGVWPFYVVAWLLGRAVRHERRTTAVLKDRTIELEAENQEKARVAVAEERARMARELHDVISHNVSVMVIQASVERHLLAEAQTSTSDVLFSIEQTGRETLVELRRLLGVLRKSGNRPELAPQPSVGHLDALVEAVGEAGLPVALSIEGEPTLLPTGIDLSAYRIVQEALTNTLKHAGPAHAAVTVRYRASELELEVTDDGPGTGDGGGSGHGLIGMRERVDLYGGTLETGAQPGGGYLVRVHLPLEPAHS